MKRNGTVALILLATLVVVTSLAWSEGEDWPVCPLTGEPVFCTGDGPHGARGMAGAPPLARRMAQALDLTEDQQAAMQELMTAEREVMRERMETALAGILTPEQQVTFDELKARRESWGGMERPGRMGRGQQGRRAAGGGPARMAERRLQHMTENLDLTVDQQEQIRQIIEEGAPPPRNQVREKIREVLTPEQRALMDQHRRQRPEMAGRQGNDRMGRRGRPMGPGGDLPRHLAWQLDLTDEQRTTLRETMSELRREHREEMRSRMDALLTPEQREKLEQIRQDRPGANR